MSKAPAPKRAYARRVADAKREGVLESIPQPVSAELRGRAEKQAKEAKAQELRAQIAQMDDETSEAVRRSAHNALARLTSITEAPPAQSVWVTVRRKGAGKISMGLHEPPYGEVHYEAGERVELPLPTANAYGPDGKDWVELDEREV